MTRSSLSRFATTALTVAALGIAPGALAYGTAAPMGVSHIEAQAPVTSVNATPTVTAPSALPTPQVRPASRLRNWIAALRRQLDGAVDVALR